MDGEDVFAFATVGLLTLMVVGAAVAFFVTAAAIFLAVVGVLLLTIGLFILLPAIIVGFVRGFKEQRRNRDSNPESDDAALPR